MSDRSGDCLAQAERDLEHERRDVDGRFFEHACFGAQQAAEKAVEAVYLSRKAEGWWHRAGTNGFASGAPKDFFTEEQARDAVRRAENIITWCSGFCRA